MAGILRRYIIKEISTDMLAVMSVLLLIYFSNRFIRMFAEASDAGVAVDTAVGLLSMKMLISLSILLPLALFLAVLLAFGRLYKDNEMVALAACGVSLKTAFRGVLGFSLAVSVVVGIVSFYLAPWAEERVYRIQDRQKAASELETLPASQFVEPEQGRSVIYTETVSADSRQMEHVFIQSNRPQKRQVILSSNRAYQRIDGRNGIRYLVLVDGYRYEGIPGDADFKIIRFHEHAIRISDHTVQASYRKKRAIPTTRLIGSGRPADQAELQWRFAMPLSTILLPLLAVPLSRTEPRQGRYAKLFVAILAYIVYSNILAVSQTWIEKGVVPGWLGMWWVHLLMLLTVWTLLARQYGFAWMFQAMFRRSRS